MTKSWDLRVDNQVTGLRGRHSDVSNTNDEAGKNETKSRRTVQVKCLEEQAWPFMPGGELKKTKTRRRNKRGKETVH